MEQKKDAITTFNQDQLAKLPPEVRERINAQITKSMKDVTARLPVIKISRETGQYIFPDNELKQDFTGIILSSNITKSYWDSKFKGDGTPPTCASLDSINPTQFDGSSPINATCGGCEMNKFGSAVDENGNNTKGKACRDIRRVHIIIDNSIFPYRLVLPPTSLYNYDDFVTRETGKTGLPISLLMVKFSTEKAESDGYKVSKFTGEVVSNTFGNDHSKLSDALDNIEKLQKEFDLAMHGQLIEDEEKETESKSDVAEPPNKDTEKPQVINANAKDSQDDLPF